MTDMTDKKNKDCDDDTFLKNDDSGDTPWSTTAAQWGSHFDQLIRQNYKDATNAIVVRLEEGYHLKGDDDDARTVVSNRDPAATRINTASSLVTKKLIVNAREKPGD